jgi:hypothetical protein
VTLPLCILGSFFPFTYLGKWDCGDRLHRGGNRFRAQCPALRRAPGSATAASRVYQPVSWPTGPPNIIKVAVECHQLADIISPFHLPSNHSTGINPEYQQVRGRHLSTIL